MKNFYLYGLFISVTCIGCSTIKETSKHQMETGLYKIKNKQHKTFYAVVEQDSIVLHPAKKNKTGWIADTSVTFIIDLKGADSVIDKTITFVNPSLDIDVLTILFKYRPYTSGFPNQLNTNFNAAGYVGYRSDLYILNYRKNPLNKYQSTINHFAYSFGFFAGLGATQMNAYVTNNNIATEYDGVVISQGIVGLVGIGNLTFGAALGLELFNG